MKNIAVIGVSGSIGTQTVDVIKNNQNLYNLVGFSVHNNIDYAIELLESFNTIRVICVKNEEDRIKLSNYNVEVLVGTENLKYVATISEANMLITAVVGAVGLKSTIHAIENKIDIGLANKETLVTAGHIIMPLVKEFDVKLLPVDSEHSAIFQCLNGEVTKDVNKLILTASGGSFRDLNRDDLKNITKQQALNHPNWSMGAKITIDSATMFNKGLEIIEAHHLFDISYDDIEVLVHKQSIIHSMVEFADYSVMAQLGTPDMRLPIQYALTFPDRLEVINSERLSLSKIGTLDFKEIDLIRYPAVAMAYEAGKLGGSMPLVLNVANEIAVDLFLKDQIQFVEIESIVRNEMDNHVLISNPTLEEIIELDNNLRIQIRERYNA